jgi:hypothetical protein
LDFEIKYKKGFEMPADYFSRNVAESTDIPNKDLAEIQVKDKYCASPNHLLSKKPVEIEFSKRITEMTKMSKNWFVEINVV